MNSHRRAARINKKALVILVVVIGVLGVGATVGHYARKRSVAASTLSAGQEALAREDWSSAARNLKLYLSKYPDDLETLEAYGRARLAIRPSRTSDVGAAIGAYRRILRHKPADPDVSKVLAGLYLRAGDPSEAAHICRKWLDAAPDTESAMLWLGRALTAQQRYDTAAEVLTRLVDLHPHTVRAYVLLSTGVIRGDSKTALDDAGVWLNRAIDANPRSAEARAQRARFRRLALADSASAREDLVVSTDFRVDDPAVALMLAEEWLEAKDLERAEAYLLVLDAMDTATFVGRDVDPGAFAVGRYVLSARVMLLRGSNADAAALVERALEAIPEPLQPEFLPYAADLHLADGRIQDARNTVERLRKLLQANPAMSGTRRERLALIDSVVAHRENRPHQVIGLLRDLVVTNPRNTQAWHMLWRAYEETGQSERALSALQAYMALSPDDGSAGTALAQKYKGRDWDKVLAYAVHAEADSPDRLAPKLLRIEATLHQAGAESADAALPDLDRELAELRRQHPKDVAIRLLQAELASRRGQREKTRSVLDEAVRECDVSWPAAVRLAESYVQDGMREAALKTYQESIAVAPGIALPRLALARFQLDDDPDAARATLAAAVEEVHAAQRPRMTYAFARFLVDHHEESEAIELLEELASQRPSDVQPRLALLAIPAIVADEGTSQPLIEELRRIEGERGLLWRIEQAKLWLQSSTWKDRAVASVELLQHAMDADFADATPVLLRAGLHERLGEAAKAEELYRRFFAAHPQQTQVAVRLLVLLERRGRVDEVDGLLRRLPEDLPVLRLLRARAAIRLGDHDQAVEVLEDSIAASPGDVDLKIGLARLLYSHRKDAAAALSLLDEAAAAAPDRIAVLRTRVEVLRAEARHDEVSALLDAAIERLGDFDTHILRAQHYTAIEAFDRAEQDYVHLTNLGIRVAEAHLALGAFYQRIGRRDDATTTWEVGLAKAPGDVPLQKRLIGALIDGANSDGRARGRKMLDELLARLPNDADLLVVKAAALVASRSPGALSGAEAALDRAITLNPRNVTAQRQRIEVARLQGDLTVAGDLAVRAIGANPGVAELTMARAGIEAELGNAGVARELARSALQADPANVAALNLLASLAIESRDLDRAESLTEEALALQPGNDFAHCLRAGIFEKRGRRQEGIEALEAYRKTKEGRRSVRALIALTELYRKEDDLAAADTVLTEAEQLAPFSPAVFLERVRLLTAERRYGEIHVRIEERRAAYPFDARSVRFAAWALASSAEQKFLRAARTLFEQLRVAKPGDAEAHRGVAQVSYRLGEIGAAVSAYRGVLSLAPYHHDALNDLAWILGVDLEETEEALGLVERGLARFPDDVNMLDTRGVLLARAGRPEEARKVLERCVTLAPEQTGARAHALLHLGDLLLGQGDRAAARTRLAEADAINRLNGVFDSEKKKELQRLLDETTP